MYVYKDGDKVGIEAHKWDGILWGWKYKGVERARKSDRSKEGGLEEMEDPLEHPLGNRMIFKFKCSPQ